MKKSYGNLWKKESDFYRHGVDVLKHQKLLSHALLKYSRSHDGNKVKTHQLIDFLLEQYCINK
ncbi:MAG: hypothetical protein LBV48_02345 [Mycoplasmataceae bacterium]|jgi:hypothetical protein|nr:hypothetical protein [Mycoplasmataceae bacterium]